MTRQNMKVIYPSGNNPRQSFAEHLEHQARGIVSQRPMDRWDASAESTLERELALVLDQIDQVRYTQRKIERGFQEHEDVIRPELSILIRSFYPCESARDRRDRLGERLLQIHRQRHRLMATGQERLHALQDRLLALLNHHRHLNP